MFDCRLIPFCLVRLRQHFGSLDGSRGHDLLFQLHPVALLLLQLHVQGVVQSPQLLESENTTVTT